MYRSSHVHETRNVGRTNVTSTKLYSVHSYDLKSMPFIAHRLIYI